MTLLMWQKYTEEHPEWHYIYNHFCRQYKTWLGNQLLSMRKQHKYAKKLLVDYCGPTIPIVSSQTGEVRTTKIFVAVMSSSNFTYVKATWSQALEDLMMSHVRCFDYFWSVPDLVIHYNLKSTVTKACHYEPYLSPTYKQLAEHYQTTVIQARPYKLQDKSKAEIGVQIVERWIMAHLHHDTLFSLKNLN